MSANSTQYGEEYSEQLTMDAVLKHAEADGLEVQYEITWSSWKRTETASPAHRQECQR